MDFNGSAIGRFFLGLSRTLGVITLVFLGFSIILAFAFFVCYIIYRTKDYADQSGEPTYALALAYTNRTSFMQIYGMIVTMVALCGPAIAYYWSMRLEKRTIISLSYDILKEWRQDKIENAIFAIKDYFDGAKSKGIDFDVAKEQLFAASRSDKDLRLAIRTILNYFETAAMACQGQHANNNIILSYFKLAFIEYYNMLSPYIKSARGEDRAGKQANSVNNDTVYNSFTNLVENLIRLDSKKKRP